MWASTKAKDIVAQKYEKNRILYFKGGMLWCGCREKGVTSLPARVNQSSWIPVVTGWTSS